MGKSTGSKAKSNNVKTQSVKTYFAPETASPILPPVDDSKMAAGAAPAFQEESDQASTLTRTELVSILETMENRFAQKVETLLKPLKDQLQEFKTSLQAVSQMAEMVLAQSITTQGEIRDLQMGEQRTNDRLLELENGSRFHNLKFRGIPEAAEDTTELSCFIASWLAQELKLEEGIAPAIDRAYRQGP